MNAKDYLRQVEKLNTQIENKLTEKLQWQNIALGITTTTEGERVRSSGNKQKMADAINCWVDAEREIDAAIDKLVDLKAEIIRTIEQLPPTEYGLEIDTTTVNAQFAAFLDGIAQELANLEAGTGVELKKLCFANTAVSAAEWASDSTYGDYPYRAAVALSGVTAAMVPEVVFGLAAMADTSFAPVAECYNGGVYIYAADAPGAAITIPTIICWRGGASA